jgi:RHS repeat-associated protein
MANAYETGGANGDGNGGMVSRKATVTGDLAKYSAAYDIEGRLDQVRMTSSSGPLVQSVYDENGQRVARIVNGTDVTYYFDKYFEVRGSQLTRHIYFGEKRIAFSPTTAPSTLTLASLSDAERQIMFARVSDEGEWTWPGRGLFESVSATHVAAGAAGSFAIVLIGLAFVPGRVRVGMLGRVQRGPVAVLAVITAVGITIIPLTRILPLGVRPAWAGGGGGGSVFPVLFVHTDHLGSTVMLTTYKVSGYADGTIAEYYRYGPYGAMKAFTPTGGTVTAGTERTDRLYTGQLWDSTAQLYYYNARFYDPMIARFMTHDPAREYMNPYAYVAWNPVKFTDPTGKFIDVGGAAGLNTVLGTWGPGRDALASPALGRGLGGVLDTGSTALGAQFASLGLAYPGLTPDGVASNILVQALGAALAGLSFIVFAAAAVATVPPAVAGGAIGYAGGFTVGLATTGTVEGALGAGTIGAIGTALVASFPTGGAVGIPAVALAAALASAGLSIASGGSTAQAVASGMIGAAAGLIGTSLAVATGNPNVGTAVTTAFSDVGFSILSALATPSQGAASGASPGSVGVVTLESQGAVGPASSTRFEGGAPGPRVTVPIR